MKKVQAKQAYKIIRMNYTLTDQVIGQKGRQEVKLF